MLETKISPPRTATEPTLGETVLALIRPIASLQLTVVLFALSLVLIFFGTLAQKNAGIWQVVDSYFWSWIVRIDTQLFVQFLQIFTGLSTDTSISIKIPFPGGKLIGAVMFVNLIAAHAVRFHLTWRRAGIFILHGGLLLMFAGEFVTRVCSLEQRMPIVEGSSANYTFDTRNHELAIVVPLTASERVVVVPASRLRPGQRLDLPELPFDLKVLSYFPNALVLELPPDASPERRSATHGLGLTHEATEIPVVSGVETDDNKVDQPAARIEIIRKGSDVVLADYLVPHFYNPQTFEFEGKRYELELRYVRHYKPYSIFLNEFRFDRYLGTNIPKNYSSNVRLTDPEHGVDTTKTISMNEPMRYRGETFYQSGVLPREMGTVLQVVENPGWLLPYISCGVVTFGMLLHFGIHLREYLRRILAPRKTASPIVQTKFERWLPWGVLAVTVLLTLAAAMPHGKPGRKGLNLESIGRLPVVDGGRVKPLDTVARVSLRQLNHKEFYTSPDDRQTRPALDWWLSTASTPPEKLRSSDTAKAEIFRIENDQILNLLGLTRREGLRYSISDFVGKYVELRDAVLNAKKKPKESRDLFDVKLLEFWEKLGTQNSIMTGEGSLSIPPADGKEWRSVAEARDIAEQRACDILSSEGMPIRPGMIINNILKDLPPAQQAKFMQMWDAAMAQSLAQDPVYKAWEDLFAAYRSGNAESFNAAVTRLEQFAAAGVSGGARARAGLETFLNDTALYFWCIGLYVLAFLLIAGAWACYTFNPGLGQAWRKSALLVLLFAFLLHTFTLFARMYLMDRPLVFVTNLYSTAVFIGWAAVGIGLLVERLIPITLGCLVASVLGFLTTILAHNLATSGDTLEMMRAVLDTNFWLATHVTTINLGYSATYMAGLIGIVYLLVGIFTPYLKKPIIINGSKQELGRMIGQILYGAVAGSTVLSFTGTVLGGIWGDQSWGRFWGWDPKENGALMIVVWNAMILHARWAGLVKDRGIAVLALGGNMVTTWSYFGTNQLGVGLHAYGFSNTLAAVCLVMWCVNLALIGLGLLPKKYWRSYQST